MRWIILTPVSLTDLNFLKDFLYTAIVYGTDSGKRFKKLASIESFHLKACKQLLVYPSSFTATQPQLKICFRKKLQKKNYIQIRRRNNVHAYPYLIGIDGIEANLVLYFPTLIH